MNKRIRDKIITMAKRNIIQERRDYELALALERETNLNTVGITENAVFPDHKNKENYKPKTLIDQTLEIIDPTPNVYTLFMQFNERFFQNKLLSVQVKWSPQMTSCAGVCRFHSRNRECVISLSAPLLKLRPRKDLVETLLHEMIHGYLFLTNNNRDRDGHGPEFCKHMDRINKEAGTHITIYHDFHDEVRLYKQHWWRCDGPCQHHGPYFGMVRRAKNRAPGPNDFWWQKHQTTCGGQYIKVKEPEPKTKPNLKRNADTIKKPAINSKKSVKGKADRSLDDMFAIPVKKPQPTTNVPIPGAKVASGGLIKLGTNTNNVHGWGTGGPSSSTSKTPQLPTNNPSRNKPPLQFSGTLGGSVTGRSNLLDKFSSPPAKKAKSTNENSSSVLELHKCPVCNMALASSQLNDHLDVCTRKRETNEFSATSGNGKRKLSVIDITSSPETFKKQPSLDSHVKSSTNVSCPVCNEPFDIDHLNEHLDVCLTVPKTDKPRIEKSSKTGSMSKENFVDLTKDEEPHSGKFYACLVCNAKISADIPLTDHLDECIKGMFNDAIDFDDDSSSDQKDSPKSSTSNEITEINGKFPCPICMDLVHENLMNEHLDICLTNQT